MGLSYYLIVFIQIYSSMCIHVFISVCVSVSVFKHKGGHEVHVWLFSSFRFLVSGLFVCFAVFIVTF